MTETVHPHQWGVQTGYHDHSGRWVEVPESTVEGILASMRASDGGPPPPRLVTVRTDHPLPYLGPGRVVLADGAVLDSAEAQRAGPDLPVGYHRFEPVEGPVQPLVVSPGRVPVPAHPGWGFATQLYATRSRLSWGIGDLADLIRLNRWAASLGAGFTLVNPLHAPTPATPRQTSPYYPGSRCFMDPIYIAVEDVPGAGHLPEVVAGAEMGRALNVDRRIDRDQVWALKHAALEAIFDRHPASPDLDRYRRERGAPLERFATYCACAEIHGPRWREWPADRAEPDPLRVRYHAWLQYLLDTQAAAAGRSLGLVIDLAIGVDPSGPDSWIWDDAFAAGMSVGAPPDEFNTQGQDWGLPPLDPWRLRAGGYEPWIEALRTGMRHGVGLRMDHVMGLFRLYWVPAGGSARDGTYVRYPHHDLLNILALEAQQAGAFVVGEDLGTVEDEVRSDLAERRVLSYRVWWFEDRPTSEWPEAAMGAVTTHDLPTVAGVLTGSDLQAQRAIGTEPNEESSAALLTKLLRETGGPPDTTAGAVEAVYRDLSHAPCVLLTATLEDVLEVEERPNMPGTTDAWPNWSVALPIPLEEMEERALPQKVAEQLNRGRPGR